MMAESTARQNILNRIRQALEQPVPLPFPDSDGTNSLFTPPAEDEAIVFAEAFTNLQGNFTFCSGNTDLIQQLSLLVKEKGWEKVYCKEPSLLALLQQAGIQPYHDLASCQASITGCEYLVARTGTMVLSSAGESGRTVSVYAPIHICIAYNSQLVYDLSDALAFLKEKYKGKLPSSISFASGPSRTADIEKTLVTGVHGPGEVYCFLVEEGA